MYKMVDLHMTDSTGHNKFLSEDVPKLFNLDHKVGQIFCCTHTNLGFCRCMNSCISVIENKTEIKNILAAFLVHMDLNSKNGSLAGQFVDCVTTLIGLEMKHKPSNRGKDFKHFCKSNDTNYEMFLRMKDLDASQKQHQLFFTLGNLSTNFSVLTLILTTGWPVLFATFTGKCT